MNINNDERRVTILRRLRLLKERLSEAMLDFDYGPGACDAREKLRLKLAEIADELGKACD